MKYFIVFVLLGLFVGWLAAHTIYTQRTLRNVREQGVQQQILKGVHPDDALAAFEREFTVQVNYSSANYNAEIFSGLIAGGACGAVLGVIAAYLADRNRPAKKPASRIRSVGN